MEIQKPKSPNGYADRHIDCEMHLEPAFRAIAELAGAAGWTGDEVELALLGLAHARINMRRCNASDEWAIFRLCQTSGPATEPNAVVAPIHAKAMSVILRTCEEIDLWLPAPAKEASALRRPLPDDALALLPLSTPKTEKAIIA